MNGNEYQNAAGETANFLSKNWPQEKSINYCMLGLVGETGEIAEKFKKKLRGDGTLQEFYGDEAIAKEFGDVLWYLSQLAALLGWSLDEVMAMNIAKLKDRRERGVIHGEGDNR